MQSSTGYSNEKESIPSKRCQICIPTIHTVLETWVQSLGQKIPWRREWLPTSVFLPGEFHGQRSLVD